MELFSPTGKPIVLPAVHANLGIISAYRRWLLGLIDSLSKETTAEIEKAWGDVPEKQIAEDSDRMSWLQLALFRLRGKWIRSFENGVHTHVPAMLGQVQRSVDGPLRLGLKGKGLAIPFRPTTAQTEALRATVRQNVAAIKSIPESALQRVEQTVWNGVMKGLSTGHIVKALREDHQIERRHAERIATEQVRRATGQLNVTRCLEVGITEGIWLHSHGGKHPRPEHVAANGKLFDLRQGMYLEGKWVWPGSEYGCNCSFKPVIRPPR